MFITIIDCVYWTLKNKITKQTSNKINRNATYVIIKSFLNENPFMQPLLSKITLKFKQSFEQTKFNKK